MRRESYFPREVVSDVPIITLIGAEEVHVEQHHGLLEYQTEQVVFRAAKGMLTVTGQKLRFRRYSASEAVLVGVIDSVETGGGV